MKILITGITGMMGSCFYKMCAARGDDVWGVARSSASSRMEAVQDERVLRCDITDRDALEHVFGRVRPELVIHMAAQAFNGMSWNCEYLTHDTNYIGTLNVIKCAMKNGGETKVLLACSSAEYGDFNPAECPLREERMLRPVTPYGVSKAGTELLGYQYFSNYGLQVFLPRMFIHVGTGHPPATAIQNFARQLALIKKGLLPPVMKVGNLETARDFIDVRDGVAAMLLMLERGEAGVPCNVCTGTAHRISYVLAMLTDIAGVRVDVTTDPGLLRASDELLLLGDNSRIKALGWQQKYSLRETLEGVFDDWMSRCG